MTGKHKRERNYFCFNSETKDKKTWMHDTPLTGAEARVLLALMNSVTIGGRVYDTTIDDLRDKTHMGRNTVIAAIKGLREKNLIGGTRNQGGGYYQISKFVGEKTA